MGVERLKKEPYYNQEENNEPIIRKIRTFQTTPIEINASSYVSIKIREKSNKNFILCIVLLFFFFKGTNVLFGKDIQLPPQKTILLLDTEDPSTLPRNWRTLNFLNASGSGQFSLGQYKKMKEILFNKALIVIDLRQESHGLINDLAISWYSKNNTFNQNKSTEQIRKDEEKKMKEIFNKKKIKLQQSSHSVFIKIQKNITTATTEKQFLEKEKVLYFRIPAPDYQKPRDQDVDEFIEIYKKYLYKPANHNQWVHFHCAAGKGRTTTFLTMYDMMKNFQSFNQKEITERQYHMGGIDLFNSQKKNKERKNWFEERMIFLKKFDLYVRENGPSYQSTWSVWLKNKNQQ